MQLKSVFFIFLFSGFLLLPAVVVLTDLDVSMNSFFSLAEEENSDTFKVEPNDRTPSLRGLLPDTVWECLQTTKVEAYYLSFWKAIYFDTLSPPPEALFT